MTQTNILSAILNAGRGDCQQALWLQQPGLRPLFHTTFTDLPEHCFRKLRGKANQYKGDPHGSNILSMLHGCKTARPVVGAGLNHRVAMLSVMGIAMALLCPGFAADRLR